MCSPSVRARKYFELRMGGVTALWASSARHSPAGLGCQGVSRPLELDPLTFQNLLPVALLSPLPLLTGSPPLRFTMPAVWRVASRWPHAAVTHGGRPCGGSGLAQQGREPWEQHDRGLEPQQRQVPGLCVQLPLFCGSQGEGSGWVGGLGPCPVLQEVARGPEDTGNGSGHPCGRRAPGSGVRGQEAC